jgi:cell division protein FtsA
MRKSVIITGLDISSSKISAVALGLQDSGLSAILAYESKPSKGIFRGSIVDIAEASNSVLNVLTRLNERLSARPDNIYTNISGGTIKGEKSRGMVPLSSRGREVTKSDVARCINAASTIRLAFDREILHKVVLNFSIDDQPGIKNPLGLYASRLSCEMYIITANVNHVQNIYKCINNAGYDTKEVVYSGMADEMSLLEDQWKEQGVVLLNMGASLTECSIFSSGSLSSVDVIPLGAGDIKGDLKASAEFNEIVSRVKGRCEEFINKTGNIKSVVITGGFSFTEGIVELLEERFSLPVKMGITRNVQGNISGIDGLRGATAIGLARYASAQYKQNTFQPKGLVHNISNRVIEIFNNYF